MTGAGYCCSFSQYFILHLFSFPAKDKPCIYFPLSEISGLPNKILDQPSEILCHLSEISSQRSEISGHHQNFESSF